MISSPEEFAALICGQGATDASGAAPLDAPVEVWLGVIDRYPDLRFDLVLIKSVPVVILERLATDEDPRVRGMVARKRKAPAALLGNLGADRDEGVRLAVACNASTPLELLEQLRTDPWEEVARAAEQRLRLRRNS